MADRCIVNVPGYLSVIVTDTPAGTALIEHRSVIVRTDDDLCRPAREFLAGHCSAELACDTLRDVDFIFRRCVRTIYQIWEVCPGDRPHRCVVVPDPREGTDMHLRQRSAR